MSVGRVVRVLVDRQQLGNQDLAFALELGQQAVEQHRLAAADDAGHRNQPIADDRGANVFNDLAMVLGFVEPGPCAALV